MKRWLGGIGLGVFLFTFPSASRAEAPSCGAGALRITVHNLGPDVQSGYIAGDASASFQLGHNESADISVRLPRAGQEQRLQAYLPDDSSMASTSSTDELAESSDQCAGAIELPSGCPGNGPAGHLYVYKTGHGYKCFFNSVAHLPRTKDSALALKK